MNGSNMVVDAYVVFPAGISVRGADAANQADLVPIREAVVLNTGTCETNSYLVAQSFAAVYEMREAVRSNAVGVSSNAMLISGLQEDVVELRGLVNGVTPAIETPDGKKWKAVGVYLGPGNPTHAWVEYTGDQYGTIVLDMPDNKHFKMVGVYVGSGDERKVTHAWQEIIYE